MVRCSVRSRKTKLGKALKRHIKSRPFNNDTEREHFITGFNMGWKARRRCEIQYYIDFNNDRINKVEKSEIKEEM